MTLETILDIVMIINYVIASICAVYGLIYKIKKSKSKKAVRTRDDFFDNSKE